MGTMLMDSAPPAMATSPCPAMIRSAAIAMDCKPDEQNRLTVIAETLTGNPARSEAIRARFIPCSASGVAQPMMTSSMSSGLTPFARASASLITSAARSSGRVARSVPFGALPTAVRTELTSTASRMAHLRGDARSIVTKYSIGCQWARKSNRAGTWNHSTKRRPPERKHRHPGGMLSVELDRHRDLHGFRHAVQRPGLILPPAERVQGGLAKDRRTRDHSGGNNIAGRTYRGVDHDVAFDSA